MTEYEEELEQQVKELQEEIRNLGRIAEAYANAQRRVERAEEMAAWAEREEARANEEAMEARRMCDKTRMAVHADKLVANYRVRAQTAERRIAAVKSRLDDIDTTAGDRAYEGIEDLLRDLNEGTI